MSRGTIYAGGEIISDPHRPCLLVRARLEAAPENLRKLKLYVLLAPHLDVGGWNNNGNVAVTPQGKVLTANKNGIWLTLQATVPFIKTSCGYVGTTDGWQDLAHDFRMDWEFDSATDGNIALFGQLDLSATNEFTLTLSFGLSLHQALVSLAQSMSQPFEDHQKRFIDQWSRAADHLRCEAVPASGDGGNLYRVSHCLILRTRTRFSTSATIASLSTPWGEAMGDEDLGGYHLVWTRDMCNSATGLLAAGHTTPPLRALSTWPARNALTAGSFRTSGSRASRIGGAYNWTKYRSRSCLPGDCIKREGSTVLIPGRGT